METILLYVCIYALIHPSLSTSPTYLLLSLLLLPPTHAPKVPIRDPHRPCPRHTTKSHARTLMVCVSNPTAPRTSQHHNSHSTSQTPSNPVQLLDQHRVLVLSASSLLLLFKPAVPYQPLCKLFAEEFGKRSKQAMEVLRYVRKNVTN